MIDNKQEAVNENVIAAITFYTNEILAERWPLFTVSKGTYCLQKSHSIIIMNLTHLYPLNIALFDKVEVVLICFIMM